MYKVFLGVGHGGSDPGAVANGVEEKQLNLSIALACQSELARHGILTVTSRSTDENDPLEEEIAECNAYGPTLAVDIHNNAGGGDGAEAYYHHGGGTGKELAENILFEFVKIGQNSRGAKTKVNEQGRDWFGFIRETIAPAVIVECAFVDNKEDLSFVDSEEKRAKVGIAIAKGILRTLGVEWVPETKADDAPIVTVQPENGGDAAEEKKEDVIVPEKKSFLDWLLWFLEKLISFVRSEQK